MQKTKILKNQNRLCICCGNKTAILKHYSKYPFIKCGAREYFEVYPKPSNKFLNKYYSDQKEFIHSKIPVYKKRNLKVLKLIKSRISSGNACCNIKYIFWNSC